MGVDLERIAAVVEEAEELFTEGNSLVLSHVPAVNPCRTRW